MNSFFKENYGILPEFILEALEQGWEIKLPLEYRKFLLEYNGGRPKESKEGFRFKNEKRGSLVHFFLGIVPKKQANLLFTINIYLGRIPLNTLPIANDQNGNLILLSVKGPDRGKIYFWDHEMEADTDHGETPDYSNLTLIADSFDEFIQNLKSKDDLDA